MTRNNIGTSRNWIACVAGGLALAAATMLNAGEAAGSPRARALAHETARTAPGVHPDLLNRAADVASPRAKNLSARVAKGATPDGLIRGVDHGSPRSRNTFPRVWSAAASGR